MAPATNTQMNSITSQVSQPFSGKKRIWRKPSPPSGPTVIPPLAI